MKPVLCKECGGPHGVARVRRLHQRTPQMPLHWDEWIYVESSNVEALAFVEVPDDHGTGVVTGWLIVKFKDDRVYAHREVPQAIFEALVYVGSPSRTGSVGKAFHHLVKGRYDSVLMEDR